MTTWTRILITIYPMPNPTIYGVNDLESLFSAAKKYEMRVVVDVHKECLQKQGYGWGDPLRLYSMACAFGLEDQAKYVARNLELLTVTRGLDVSNAWGLSLGSYHRLVSFIAERDNE